MVQPTLYLMLGYPGAGKTTAAKAIAKLTGARHLASDQLRLEMFPSPRFTPSEHEALYKELDKRTEQLLKQGKSVVYDANLNRYIHRQEKYGICQRVGGQARLVWLKVDKATARLRAVHTSRNHLVPPDEAPEAMFERIVSILEPPRANEPAVELDGTKISEPYVKRALSL